jgi:hypothetical protein
MNTNIRRISYTKVVRPAARHAMWSLYILVALLIGRALVFGLPDASRVFIQLFGL